MSFDIIFQNAINLHQSGKFDEAEKVYRQLLEISPENPDVLHLLGVIAMQRRAFESALDLLYKAVKLSPNTIAYEFTLAQALQDSGRPIEALEHYKSVLSKDDSLPDTYNNMGVIYRSIGQVKEAHKMLEIALDKKPDFALAKVNLALLERDFGHLEQAVDLLNQAQADDPNEPESFAQLATTLRMIGAYEGAADMAKKAISLVPDNPLYWNGLGVICEHLNDLDAAFDAYSTAIRLAPDYPDAYNNRANIYAKRNQHWEAEDDYKKAVKLDPKYAEAFNNLGALLYDHERYEEALECYRKAFIINPKQAETSSNLAMAVKEAGDPAEAVGLYLNALHLNPKLEKIHHYLAQTLHDLYVHQKEPDLAKKLAHKWLEFFPENPVAKHVCESFDGNNPNRATTEYIKNLFDAFAPNFEAALNKLNYQIPTLLEKSLSHLSGGLRILDAGCGTGLNAALLNKYAARLDGIDLSEKMIELAGEKNLYDRLETTDIIEYMHTHQAGYDLIVLADVACYFGDLAPLFGAVFGALDDNGEVLLTLEETTDTQKYSLQPSGRFAHNVSEPSKILVQLGFENINITHETLRTENNIPVKGMLIRACKTDVTKKQQ